MAVRVLLVLTAFAVLYGCGRASSPVEKHEKQEGVEQPEKVVASGTRSCSDFYGPQDAQAYFDSKATAAEKRSLNPDGNEWACNEAGVTFKPEPEISLANFAKLSDQQSLGLLQCQYRKYAADHGQEAADQYVNNKLDEELGGGQITQMNNEVTSVQEHWIRDGYSCTWHEINETMMQQAASASASASAP